MNEVLEQPVSKLDHLVARDGEGVKAAAVPRVGRGLARVVFSSLLVTIVLAAIPYGTVEPWWVAVFECLVFVLGLLRKNVQQSPGFFLPYLRNDGRGFGQFINKNHFAFLMEMSLGLSLGLLVGEVGRHRRTLVLLPILGLLWFALVSSNSRGGIIASLCQLLILGALLDPVRHLTNQRARPTCG